MNDGDHALVDAAATAGFHFFARGNGHGDTGSGDTLRESLQAAMRGALRKQQSNHSIRR